MTVISVCHLLVLTRVSVLIKDRASVLYDPAIDAIRILPPPRVQVQFSNQQLAMRGRVPATLVSSPESELVSSESEASPTSQQVSRRAESANRSKIAKERISKVPRPPNAFILYRQHHHPMVKQNNPGVHNNQICKSTMLFWCSSYLFANISQLCSSVANGRTKIQQ